MRQGNFLIVIYLLDMKKLFFVVASLAFLAVGCKNVSDEQKLADYQDWVNTLMEEYKTEVQNVRADSTLTDDQKAEKFEACYEKTSEKYKNESLKIIRKNPESPVAVEALKNIRYELEDDELVAVLATLKGAAAEDEAIAKIRKPIEARQNTAEGKMFTDFTVDHVASIDKKGEPVYEKHSLSDFVGKGKVMLVDFWSPWCPPCKAEIPNIKNVWEKYHGEDFDVLSVAVWEESRRMDYRNTIDTAAFYGVSWLQLNNGHQEPAALYGIEGIPHMILFDRDGTILKRGIRGEEVDEAVAEALGR